jgi:hypothetical protein
VLYATNTTAYYNQLEQEIIDQIATMAGAAAAGHRPRRLPYDIARVGLTFVGAVPGLEHRRRAVGWLGNSIVATWLARHHNPGARMTGE